jgi:hypothetical protein
MASPKLRLVAQPDEHPMLRVQQLQEEARIIAMGQVAQFETALLDLCEKAKVLADAGEAIPAGVRELCRSFSDEAEQRAKTLGVLTLRYKPEAHKLV